MIRKDQAMFLIKQISIPMVFQSAKNEDDIKYLIKLCGADPEELGDLPFIGNERV